MAIHTKKINVIFIIIIIITGMSSSSLLLPLAASKHSNLFTIKYKIDDEYFCFNQSDNQVVCQRKSININPLHFDKETRKTTSHEPMKLIRLIEGVSSDDNYLCTLYYYLLSQCSESYKKN